MTDQQNTTPAVVVTQADRDAAARYVSGDHGWAWNAPSAVAIRDGKACHDLVQAFAAHRIAAERAYARFHYERGLVAGARRPIEQGSLMQHRQRRDTAHDAAERTARPEQFAWPEYDTDIPDALDAYSRECSDAIGRFGITERMSGTFRWHEAWERVRQAIAARTPERTARPEHFAWPEPKFVPMGTSGQQLNPERVTAAFGLLNAELVIGEQFRLIEMMLDGTDYTVCATWRA